MHLPYLADRASVTDAEELIAHHGEAAATEASRRAGRSRDLGNHVHFCRWRQIERWIRSLAQPESAGSIH
jgi:hypothetical protein